MRQVWNHPSNRDHRLRSLGRAVGWQVSKRLSARPRDVGFYGFTLRCHPDSNSGSNVIYFTERFDPDEMAVVESLLDEGDGFVDVGANIGTYALMARRFVGPSGHVVAFEPDPVAARRLRENVELNGLSNIVVHQAAVTGEPGWVEMLVGYDVSNSIAPASEPHQSTRTAEAVTLDEALSSHHFAVGKLDVEGFEVDVLRGATSRLAAADPPVWIIEIMEWQLAKAGSSSAELVRLLDEHGFELFGIDGAAGLIAADRNDHGFNFLAIANGHVDRVRQRLLSRTSP
jgi:FkbM family methyltransferase